MVLWLVFHKQFISKCAKTKGRLGLFAFHLSYKLGIAEPEASKQSTKTLRHYQDTVSASLALCALKCKGSWED